MNSFNNQPAYYKVNLPQPGRGSKTGLGPVYNTFLEDLKCTPGHGKAKRKTRKTKKYVKQKLRRPKRPKNPFSKASASAVYPNCIRNGKLKPGCGIFDEYMEGEGEFSDSSFGDNAENETDHESTGNNQGKGIYVEDDEGKSEYESFDGSARSITEHDRNLRKVKYNFMKSHILYLKSNTIGPKIKCYILYDLFVDWCKDKDMSNTPGENNIIEKFFDYVKDMDSQKKSLLHGQSKQMVVFILVTSYSSAAF